MPPSVRLCVRGRGQSDRRGTGGRGVVEAWSGRSDERRHSAPGNGVKGGERLVNSRI
jgi:hypothetical protein